MERVYRIRIAELDSEIVCQGYEEGALLKLLPSLRPFLTDECKGNPLFKLTINDKIETIPTARKERIRDFQTGNGTIVVDSIYDGGYQYIIKNEKGAGCALLQTNKDFSICRCALNGNYMMRSYGLNNALMLAFSFASSRLQCIMLHASLVRKDGYGYAFIAPSGTGKSTQVSMWLRHLPGCDLMNDDTPIVRFIDNRPYVYGSPWSGKTPCYRNVKAPLGAITQIVRATENRVEKLNTINAFVALLPACSSMKWDKDNHRNVCDTISRLIETTGIYALHCLPNQEAAVTCYTTINKK